jgi:hypothetical protein
LETLERKALRAIRETLVTQALLVLEELEVIVLTIAIVRVCVLVLAKLEIICH